jgi:hypothetical protein
MQLFRKHTILVCFIAIVICRHRPVWKRCWAGFDPGPIVYAAGFIYDSTNVFFKVNGTDSTAVEFILTTVPTSRSTANETQHFWDSRTLKTWVSHGPQTKHFWIIICVPRDGPGCMLQGQKNNQSPCAVCPYWHYSCLKDIDPLQATHVLWVCASR